MTQLKYKEVEKEIRQLAKTLPVGAKIPPERHLAISYNCNFLTIRKALKSLVEDGIIIRRVGSGSFVAEHNGHVETKTFSSGKSNRIGLLVYHKSNTYAHKILQGLAHIAMEDGLELRSSWIRDFNQEGLRQANGFAQEGCVSIVLPWFPHDMTEEITAFIKKSPLPVSIPLVIPGLEKHYFGRPELFGLTLLQSTESLCRYFHALGRRHIALLGPSMPNDAVLQKMLSAYTCYISQENLPNMCGLVTHGSNAMDQLAARWKASRGDLGIVSYDDEHALRFITAMHKIGLNAPKDFAIIGHNDVEASRFSDPPLSTISQDFLHISRGLIRNALALSKGQSAQDNSLPRSCLLVRGTCGGRGHITEALKKELPDLEFILNESADTATSGLSPAS